MKRWAHECREYLLAERANWPLWLPVFFGIGIALYFSMHHEPWRPLGIILCLILSLKILRIRHHVQLFYPLLTFLAVALGFSTAQLRTAWLDTTLFPLERQAVLLEGTLEAIHLHTRGKRLFLSHLQSIEPTDIVLPERARISANTSLNGAEIGDRIRIKAILYPPPAPSLPGGYDIARSSYFEGIGALGYTISAAEILAHGENSTFATFILNLRQKIVERIAFILPKSDAGIATALLVGEVGSIPSPILDAMRGSGLAHLLAISGLNLTLVASLFYFCSRRLLSLSMTLTLYYPIKQWAALVALMGSAVYLLLSGMPISAQRAFIMTSLILLAVMLGRIPTPLRSVALAAFVVLLLTPESLLTPSFQMSFAASIALIAAFEHYRQPTDKNSNYYISMVKKLWLYPLAVGFSSLIAGLATAPFSLYHFQQYAPYSILANLVAVPITSFWVMPAGVLALLLMPLGLDAPLLHLMAIGIKNITATARFFYTLPHPAAIPPPMPVEALVLITLGSLWLCLWQKRWRIAGLLPILAGVILTASSSLPTMIIDGQNRVFAVREPGGVLWFSEKIRSRYTREAWLEGTGSHIARLGLPLPEGLSCTQEGACIYHTARTKIYIGTRPLPEEKRLPCPEAERAFLLYYANETELPAPDCPTPIEERRALKKQGTYLVWDSAPPTLLSTRESRGNRPWVIETRWRGK